MLIYGLVDPRTDQVRYVGRSIYGLARPRALSRASVGAPGYVLQWRDELRAEGYVGFGVRVLEHAKSFRALLIAEVRWQAFGLKNGWPLLNRRLTSGGGAVSIGRIPGTHSRDRRVAARVRDQLAIELHQLFDSQRSQGANADVRPMG